MPEIVHAQSKSQRKCALRLISFLYKMLGYLCPAKTNTNLHMTKASQALLQDFKKVLQNTSEVHAM